MGVLTDEFVMKPIIATLGAVTHSWPSAALAFAEGAKGAKTPVQMESLRAIHESSSSFVPMLSASIHIPSQKDIHVAVSTACGLATVTTVKGKHSGDGRRIRQPQGLLSWPVTRCGWTTDKTIRVRRTTTHWGDS